jgi:hypothetical protein
VWLTCRTRSRLEGGPRYPDSREKRARSPEFRVRSYGKACAPFHVILLFDRLRDKNDPAFIAFASPGLFDFGQRHPVYVNLKLDLCSGGEHGP